MKPVIGIVDYGMGNLRSVEKGFEKAGVRAAFCSGAGEIMSCEGLVLPGVGAFRDAMANLENLGLLPVLAEYIKSGRNLLGICLGMQLLFSSSEEHGEFKGLGVIPGRVIRLPDSVKVPHMGWNVMNTVSGVPLFKGIKSGTRFYFVHSYYCVPEDSRCTIGTTPYGVDFASAVRKKNIWGLQFHPEKSSLAGLRMLKNFANIVSGG